MDLLFASKTNCISSGNVGNVNWNAFINVNWDLFIHAGQMSWEYWEEPRDKENVLSRFLCIFIHPSRLAIYPVLVFFNSKSTCAFFVAQINTMTAFGTPLRKIPLTFREVGKSLSMLRSIIQTCCCDMGARRIHRLKWNSRTFILLGVKPLCNARLCNGWNNVPFIREGKGCSKYDETSVIKSYKHGGEYGLNFASFVMFVFEQPIQKQWRRDVIRVFYLITQIPDSVFLSLFCRSMTFCMRFDIPLTASSQNVPFAASSLHEINTISIKIVINKWNWNLLE